MARETLATLRSEVERLLQCCENYKGMLSLKDQEIDALKAAATQLPPATNYEAKKVEIQNRVDQLTEYAPFSRVECPTHGRVVVNKHGYCNHCYNNALGKKEQQYARRQN